MAREKINGHDHKEEEERKNKRRTYKSKWESDVADFMIESASLTTIGSGGAEKIISSEHSISFGIEEIQGIDIEKARKVEKASDYARIYEGVFSEEFRKDAEQAQKRISEIRSWIREQKKSNPMTRKIKKEAPSNMHKGIGKWLENIKKWNAGE